MGAFQESPSQDSADAPDDTKTLSKAELDRLTKENTEKDDLIEAKEQSMKQLLDELKNTQDQLNEKNNTVSSLKKVGSKVIQ